MRRVAPLAAFSRKCAAPIAMAILLPWLVAACGGATGAPVAPTAVAGTPTAAFLAGPTTPPSPTTASPTPARAAAAATASRSVPAPPATAARAASATAVAAAPTSTATPAPVPTPVPRAGRPVRLRIPRIRVDAAIEYVGLAPDGAMDVPKDYANTAWYEPGPRPGDQGNAAIAGHVDSQTGPAVFWNLPKLQPGDEVFVAGDDGVERRFIVTALESYQRADAPLDRIFGPTLARQLNLITCDPNSNFDRRKREYAANVVVYTELAP